jgi:hypothetical protein
MARYGAKIAEALDYYRMVPERKTFTPTHPDPRSAAG